MQLLNIAITAWEHSLRIKYWKIREKIDEEEQSEEEGKDIKNSVIM